MSPGKLKFQTESHHLSFTRRAAGSSDERHVISLLILRKVALYHQVKRAAFSEGNGMLLCEEHTTVTAQKQRRNIEPDYVSQSY